MPKKVLIIEDYSIFAEIFNMRLQAMSLKVITANDGHKGLKRARKEAPDLIYWMFSCQR